MSEESSVEKFVENMRAAGHSDEFIADNLIGAGQDELIVLNALGVSSLDELKDDEDPAPSDTTPAPAMSVDEQGNLEFNPQPDLDAVAPEPVQPGEVVTPHSHQPEDTSTEKLLPHHEESAPEAEPMPTNEEVQESEESTPEETVQTHQKPEPAEPEPETVETPEKQEVTEPEHQAEHLKETTTPRRQPVSATSVHSLGSISAQPRAVHQSDNSHSNHTEHPSSEHPHTYQDTMHDIAAHKEITAASHHDLTAGAEEEAESPPPQTEVKPVAPIEPKSHEEVPARSEPEDQEPLPQEINVEELEVVDGDLHNLQKTAEVLSAAPRQQTHTGPVDPAAMAHQVTEGQKISAELNQLKNNVLLKVFLVLCAVLLLIGFAISVMLKLV